MGERHDTRCPFGLAVTRFALVLAIALLTLGLSAACGGDDGGGDDDGDAAVGDGDGGPGTDGQPAADGMPPPETPDRMWVIPWEASICPGKVLQATATGIYETEGGELHQDLTMWATWTTDDAAVATVNHNDIPGQIRGEATGFTTITADYGGVSDSVDLEVIVDEVAAMIIQPPNVSLAVGEEYDEFEATLVTECGNFSSDATNIAVWTVQLDSVAEVLAAGHVKGLFNGVTKVFADADDYHAEANLTVTPAVPKSLRVDPATHSMSPTDTFTFTAYVTYTDDTEEERTAHWWSSSPGIVEVTNEDTGEVEAVSTGGCAIYAEYSEGGETVEGYASVTVTD